MKLDNNKVVIIFSSAGSEAESEHIAKCVVDERLAACVQRMPVSSIYRWKGNVESASEWLLIIKTQEVLVEKVTSRIRELHSYELPEIVVVSASGGLPEYLNWIVHETESNSK